MIDRIKRALTAKLLPAVFVFTAMPVHVWAQDVCEAKGVVLGFFNGVQTTDVQADFAVAWLRKLYPSTTPAGEPITYELFYNDTEGFADFVETFEQRLQEHNGLLAGRFELFFSAAKGEGGWWAALTSVIPSLTSLLGSFLDASTTATIKLLISDAGDPNTVEVSARHKQQIDHWAGLNQKMLLLAHSQGNLFVNPAYIHAVGKTGNEYVRVVHVAPASPVLSGRHTLADKDLVINALRLTGAVAANTDVIPGYVHRPAGLNGSRDLMGHGLLEIYLNTSLSTAGRIRGDVVNALHELDAAPRKPMPPYPDFVYREWEGGSAPARVYAPNEASHEVWKVIRRDSFGVLWQFTSNLVWRNLTPNFDHYPQSEIFETSLHFVGKQMNGFVECTYNLPVEGWIDLLSNKCVYEKVMAGVNQFTFHVEVPDELLALGRVPVGTVVSLKEMTYSSVDVAHAVRHIDTPQASIEFYSGIKTLEDRNTVVTRVWSEPYWFKRGALLNAQELEAHSKSLRSHEMAEYLRYQQHALLQWEYEQKRMACGSGA